MVRVNDKSWLVEEITIRTIRLRDLGGTVHMIPFSSVEMVENMTKDFSRYVFDVGVAGIHRLLAYRERLAEASVVIVAASSELSETGAGDASSGADAAELEPARRLRRAIGASRSRAAAPPPPRPRATPAARAATVGASKNASNEISTS